MKIIIKNKYSLSNADKIFLFFTIFIPLFILIFIFITKPVSASSYLNDMTFLSSNTKDALSSFLDLSINNLPQHSSLFCSATFRNTTQNVSNPTLKILTTDENFYRTGHINLSNYSVSHFIISKANASGNIVLRLSSGVNVYKLTLSCYQLNFNIPDPNLSPNSFSSVSRQVYVDSSNISGTTEQFNFLDSSANEYFVINTYDARSSWVNSNSIIKNLDNSGDDLPLFNYFNYGTGPYGGQIKIYGGVVKGKQNSQYSIISAGALNVTTILSTRFIFSKGVQYPQIFDNFNYAFPIIRNFSDFNNDIYYNNNESIVIFENQDIDNFEIYSDFYYPDNYLDYTGGAINMVIKDEQGNFIKALPTTKLINSQNLPFNSDTFIIDKNTGFQMNSCQKIEISVQFNRQVINQDNVIFCIYEGLMPDSDKYFLNQSQIDENFPFQKTYNKLSNKIIFGTFIKLEQNVKSLFNNLKDASRNKNSNMSLYFQNKSIDLLEIKDNSTKGIYDFIYNISTMIFYGLFIVYIIFRARTFINND